MIENLKKAYAAALENPDWADEVAWKLNPTGGLQKIAEERVGIAAVLRKAKADGVRLGHDYLENAPIDPMANWKDPTSIMIRIPDLLVLADKIEKGEV